MIGNALGWKYNNEQGIRTKGNKITGWPSKLGAKPTKEEQAIIIQEYEQYVSANKPLTRDEKISLIDNANSLPELKKVLKEIL